MLLFHLLYAYGWLIDGWAVLLKLKVVGYIEVHKSMVSFGYNKEQLILQVV